MKNLYSATKVVLLTMVFALVYMSIMGITIPDTFTQTLRDVIIFYFGQKTNQIISDAKTLAIENKETPKE